MKTLMFITGAVLVLAGAAWADTIQTTDGRMYDNAVVQSVEPDGILVSFDPVPGGIGLAKIKFRNLPEQWQKRYDYDSKKANDYEQQQAQSRAQWRSQLAAQQDMFSRYRYVAELNRGLGGDALSSYSIAMDANGAVTAYGFTGNTYPYTGIPYVNVASQPAGQQNSQPAEASK